MSLSCQRNVLYSVGDWEALWGFVALFQPPAVLSKAAICLPVR